MTLTLGFSPCPNDCFMFDAIVHHRIDLEGLQFEPLIADVETLNHIAFDERIDVTKLSYHALAHCTARYALLAAGSALGRGCGPLLISKHELTREDVATRPLRIAIPGVYTTANLLLRLALPTASEGTPLDFSEIESAVVSGEYDAGVIIHENRFTYQSKGLRRVADLGELWEESTGAAIPLGGIVVGRALPEEVQAAMNRVMRRSVEFAFDHPDASRAFVREHAQEMSEEVLHQHIALYVNRFSIDLGDEGRRGVQTLFDRGAAAGVTPPLSASLYAPSSPLQLRRTMPR